jgi:Putative zinc-finger
MPNQQCADIRDQVMFFIDNELPETKRLDLIGHFDHCDDCQQFFEAEQDIKSKICKKLKDSYLCECDVTKLTTSIKDKINEIINP